MNNPVSDNQHLISLSVVIVNYNVRYFLEQVLLSVRNASKNVAVEVFVVDNNSVDDSVEMVQEHFPEVTLIANRENVGFSKANNQAIRQANGKYILLLNPDTVVEEDTFEKVVAFMEAHPDAGGLGVKMIDGSGNFLPESKRGFPTPWVAFCKTFGLSTFFPKSKTFNHYHLGYLDKDKTHEVEILAGAFMLMRKSVLDEIGLLDETFFMYGEDIDLSYRIIKAGYKNYYFADTTIIHYKGESTKKGSLNYVKVFYNAMLIFAKKHFVGRQAWLFSLMIQFAIYFRAGMTLLGNFFKKAYLPILDAAIIVTGLVVLKDFWAVTYFNDPNYYDPLFMVFNAPLYTAIWILGIFFSGGYDHRFSMGRLFRGVFMSTVVMAAIYGFLPAEYRTSRMLIVMGAIWTLLGLTSLRFLLHFFKHKNFQFTASKLKNIVIVGEEEESTRVENLLRQAQLDINIIGIVTTKENKDSKRFLGSLSQLDEIVHIYKINEIIYCSADVTSQQIMQWMTKLGAAIDYKIVPEQSMSIIGSSSKDTSGELYTIHVKYKIASLINKRNKRLLDIGVSLLLLVFAPLLFWFSKHKKSYFTNIFKTIINQKTWVGYHPEPDNTDLPKLKKGVLNPADGLNIKHLSLDAAKRLNFLYARDYSVYDDMEIIRKGF